MGDEKPIPREEPQTLPPKDLPAPHTLVLTSSEDAPPHAGRLTAPETIAHEIRRFMEQGFSDLRLEIRQTADQSHKVLLDHGRQQIEQLGSELQAELRSDVQTIKTSIQQIGNDVANAQARTDKSLGQMTVMVAKIWGDMYGSTRPPPPPESHFQVEEIIERTKSRPDHEVAKPIPIEQKLSGEYTFAGMHGQMIAFGNELGAVRKEVSTVAQLQREHLGKQDPDNPDKRPAWQKIVSTGAWMMREREGHKFLLLLIAAVGTLVTSLQGHGAEHLQNILPK